jgi:alpha-L-fucosidase
LTIIKENLLCQPLKNYFFILKKPKLYKIYGLATKPLSAKIIGDPSALLQLIIMVKNTDFHFPNVKFDKDVTVVELTFDTPPVFLKDFKAEEYLS